MAPQTSTADCMTASEAVRRGWMLASLYRAVVLDEDVPGIHFVEYGRPAAGSMARLPQAVTRRKRE